VKEVPAWELMDEPGCGSAIVRVAGGGINDHEERYRGQGYEHRGVTVPGSVGKIGEDARYTELRADSEHGRAW
jgi:hypothetical protein